MSALGQKRTFAAHKLMSARTSERLFSTSKATGMISGIEIFYGFIVCCCAMRLWGVTRITPPRGLSMSAIKKNEIDMIIGKISRNILVRCSPYPKSKLQEIAINPINAHAAPGMRFHQAA
jgi:hypothetical protein